MILTIERIGHLGDGIARGPDGPIYAPQTLPGEQVEGTLQGDSLTDIRILTPAPDRKKPPCAHARTCGGCLMQHASDSFVENWKEGIVRGALAGQGLDAPFRPTHTSPARTRRRATLAARKTKGGALLGFHARGSDLIIPVPNCQLLHPDLIATFPALEAITRLGGSRTVELALTVTRSLAGPDVAVTGGKPLDAALHLDLARLAEQHGLARLTWDGETVALRAAPMQRFGQALVAPPPAAFLQATADGESALLAAVADAIGPDARRIADLFAGSGTFALPLAERAEVHAVEGDAAMMAALEKGWRNTPGLKRISTETRDLFRRPLEPDEFKGIDAVVIDPPRAGAEAQFATLSRSAVPVIAAVSCNPATFARDARMLVQAGWHLDWVQVVDQFRWSSHVELAARFRRPA
ncbi:class I SAM-dependent RNA methyltransferase [Paragemmobacter ruber]|uniref:Class I SAM-dependent RNA methyltransferase n=1 Tax=Paragemmobacter ruber TaxID=1985673 RepID=A0ABW9Y475_9RHOB|nr:class I SAM-dependent RNA methyltransferase [Rhodobacter ruber]NBE07336.1 class I SAM-dependent RNA methyltransferase [Rhodobacter ruber]